MAAAATRAACDGDAASTAAAAAIVAEQATRDGTAQHQLETTNAALFHECVVYVWQLQLPRRTWLSSHARERAPTAFQHGRPLAGSYRRTIETRHPSTHNVQSWHQVHQCKPPATACAVARRTAVVAIFPLLQPAARPSTLQPSWECSGLAGETAALLNLAEKANRVVQRHAAAHLQLRMRHAVLTVMCDWIERGIGCWRVDPIRGGGALGPSSKQVNTQQEV